VSPVTYTNLSTGPHTFAVKVIDQAGNVSPSATTYTWTIDLVAPTPSITSGPSNPTTSRVATFAFTSNEVGSTFLCNLDTGGYSACTSPKSYTGLGLGTHTFQVKVTDRAGNTNPTPASFSWTIKTTYTFDGFYWPVKNPPVVNRVKAGSYIPFRFSLGGDFGPNIFATGYPQSQAIACPAGSASSELELEETVAPGANLLVYNPLTKRYIYIWKTERSWAGTCRQFTMKLTDGTTQVATFRFTR
jgi:hypothetical protein